MTANRPAAPGGRRRTIGVRVTDHELAWITAHKPRGVSPGQYLGILLSQEQARVAAAEHRAQMNPDGDPELD